MYKTFSTRLKQLRLAAGMTQLDLADKLHTERSTIAGYETKHRIPGIEILCKIADLFGVSVDYLLGRD